MNEIVSVKNKNNLDGYKLFYPNDKNLIVDCIRIIKDYLLAVMKVVT